LGVGQIDEILSGEEVSAYVLHHPFHPRFGQRRRLHPIPMIASR
jgi:hypothetical protein